MVANCDVDTQCVFEVKVVFIGNNAILTLSFFLNITILSEVPIFMFIQFFRGFVALY